MKQKENSITEIQDELKRVINDLIDTADNLKKTQENIGENTISDILYERANKYDNIRKNLSKIKPKEEGNIISWL